MTLRERFAYSHQRLWERVESAACWLSEVCWTLERLAGRKACDWNRLLQDERGWTWISTGENDDAGTLTAAKFEETRQRMLNGYGRRWL